MFLADFYVRSPAGFKYNLPVIGTQTEADDMDISIAGFPSNQLTFLVLIGYDKWCRNFHTLCSSHLTLSLNNVVARLRELDDLVHGDDGQVFATSYNNSNRESC